MWKLKSCPKCDGDLYVDWDMNGEFVQCLQCGYLADLASVLKAKSEVVKKEEGLVRTGHAKPIAK